MHKDINFVLLFKEKRNRFKKIFGYPIRTSAIKSICYYDGEWFNVSEPSYSIIDQTLTKKIYSSRIVPENKLYSIDDFIDLCIPVKNSTIYLLIEYILCDIGLMADYNLPGLWNYKFSYDNLFIGRLECKTNQL